MLRTTESSCTFVNHGESVCTSKRGCRGRCLIGPAECTVFHGDLRRIHTSQRADVGIGPLRSGFHPTNISERAGNAYANEKKKQSGPADGGLRVCLDSRPGGCAAKWRSLMPSCRELRVEVGCGKGQIHRRDSRGRAGCAADRHRARAGRACPAMEAAIRKGLKMSFLSRLMRRILTSFLPTTRLTCFILISRPMAAQEKRQAPPDIPYLSRKNTRRC